MHKLLGYTGFKTLCTGVCMPANRCSKFGHLLLQTILIIFQYLSTDDNLQQLSIILSEVVQEYEQSCCT